MAENPDPVENGRGWRNLAGFTLAALAAAVILVPPVVYQMRHFGLPWTDVGTYARPLWNFFEHGRFVAYSDGDPANDFFIWDHFEPFFLLLCVPVRLFGTPGFIALITGALVLSAGYVYLLSAEVCRSRWIGMLVGAAFVANPYTYAIALSYHVEPFGILFLLAFAYYSYVGRILPAWTALLLALVVKEDMWLYACVIALMLARPGSWKRSAAFGLAAVGYYVVAVALIGRWMYPTAHYLNAYYQTGGHTMTKAEMAGAVLGRWQEYLSLLFTGPGYLFQLSVLFLGVLSGWRYLLICGVMLIWLTFPGGPPRASFAYYYSYAALLVSFVSLPLALNSLRRFADRRLPAWLAGSAGSRLAAGVLVAMVATDILLHQPGHVPGPIDNVVNPKSVYGPGPHVNVSVVRLLIDRYLAGNSDSVLAQYFTIMAIPQRRGMYITFKEGGLVLEGKLRPTFILIDLAADDPIASPGMASDLAAMLRRRDRYQPVWDDQGVLLYRLIGSASER